MEVFGPSANPAVRGVIRQDRMYWLQSMPSDMSEEEARYVGSAALGAYVMGEQNISSRGGVELPVGQRFGLSVEVAGGSFDNKVGAPFSFDLFGENTVWFHDRETNLGGAVSAGVRALDWLSLGAGTHLYHNTVHKTDEEVWDTGAEGDRGRPGRQPPAGVAPLTPSDCHQSSSARAGHWSRGNPSMPLSSLAVIAIDARPWTVS